MSKPLVMTNPKTLDLDLSSIPGDWVLSGTPKAWNKEIAGSNDRISHVIVWECSAGSFKWHYSKDESVVVLLGEAFLIKPNGEELRFGAGDVGFFPAGTTCTWRVPGRFRKVAVMREPMWRPLGYALKAWNRLLKMAGLTPRPTMVPTDHGAFIGPGAN